MHFIAALLLALVANNGDKPDLVTLESGKQIECRVMFEDDARLFYKAGRKVTEISKDEVAEIHSIERSMRTFLERYGELDATNVTALADLAQWAEANDLPGESRNLWIRILLIDGENEQAWTKLGGSHGKKGWRIRVRGRYKSLEDLRERASEWKTAMEISTAHYMLRTNIDPLLALDLSLEVERIHQMYYELIGRPMQLYPFDEIPEIHIFADADDAPRPPQPTWSAWYERVGNTLMVRGEEADRGQVRQSFTYLLLRNSFRLAQGNRDGALPTWAREGISSSFSLAMRPSSEGMQFETGVPYMPWYDGHADDEKPLSIKQVLDSGPGSFNTGKEEDRYNRQAYTLVQFLIHASDAKYRELFVAYLRSAFDGKGAASHFEKIFGVKVKDLDPEYQSYVKEVSGR